MKKHMMDKFDDERNLLHCKSRRYLLSGTVPVEQRLQLKDMALSILPHLMTTSAKKNQVKNEIVILTATSGDTGKSGLWQDSRM